MSDSNPYSPSPGLESPSSVTPISSIEFELTEKDFIAFNIYVYKARGLFRRAMVILIAVMMGALGLVIMSRSLENGDSSWATFLPLLGIFVVVFALYPWLLKRTIRKNVKLMLKGSGAKAIFGRHTLSINPQSLIKKNEYQYNEMKWSIMEDVRTTDDYLYIMPTGINAYIVPREAFQSDGEFQGFSELAREYFDASREE